MERSGDIELRKKRWEACTMAMLELAAKYEFMLFGLVILRSF